MERRAVRLTDEARARIRGEIKDASADGAIFKGAGGALNVHQSENEYALDRLAGILEEKLVDDYNNWEDVKGALIEFGKSIRGDILTLDADESDFEFESVSV